jgi:hydroxymethylpyrimidine/phosphomethylpyrimidine kinase
MPRSRTVLTISLSDPTAVDGIQADLKTFSSLGVHGTAVITGIGGGDIPPVELEPALIEQQIDAVQRRARPDFVMTGRLLSPANVSAVAARLRENGVERVVVDPVIVGAGGAMLADDATVEAILSELMPLALVVTPNLPEAGILARMPVGTWDEVRLAAEQIASRGARNVVVKGGRREGSVVTDLLFDGSDFREYSTERVPADGIAGAGSAFAAALAATLAKGETVQHAVAAAKAFVTKGLQNAYEVGDGSPAMHHFYRYWQPRGD